jgi:NADH-quinone oxidoreductase subunit G
MSKLTIDGKNITAKPGETVLEAASRIGIRIPTLCYYKKLSPIGSCRICMVEIEGAESPMTACTTQAIEGMVVHTNTPKVRELRRTALRLMILEHHITCYNCDTSSSCALQDLAYEYEIEEHGFDDLDIDYGDIIEATPLLKYNPRRCVMCLRCVHACKEIKGIDALKIVGKGISAHIEGDPEKCVSCGECFHVCPVGALTQNLTQPPVWLHTMEKVKTTCPYCGVGCQIELRVHNNKVWGVTTKDAYQPNNGSLCVKGRFGFDFIDHSDRLTQPKIRKNGKLEEVSWDEAFSFIGERIKKIKEEHGPDAVMGLTSARVTNEENYQFQKFIRAGIGTNNVDHCARL